MNRHVDYGPGERLLLGALGIFGFLGVNGAFAYGLLKHPGALEAAMANPVAAASGAG